MKTVFRRLRQTPRPVPLLLVVVALGVVLSGCIGTQPIGWSGALVSGQVLYIGDPHGNLLAYDVVNLEQRWTRELKGTSRSSFGCAGPVRPSSAIYGTPATANDLVYATSYNGKVYAFSTTGAERWVYPREGSLQHIVSGPALGANSLFFGAEDGRVYALDAATGDFKWSFATGTKVWATPAVDGDIVYAGGLDGRMYALNAATGKEAWRSEKMGGIVGTPALNADTLFIGSLDRNLYALDRSTGKEKWRFSGGRWFWTSPMLKGNTVIAANTDGTVHAVDAATGKEIWRSVLDSTISSTPAFIDGVVAVGAEDGRIYVLNEATGKPERNSLSLGSAIQGPLVAQGTSVYARVKGVKGTYIYAVNIKTGAMLSAPLEPVTTPAPATAARTPNWLLPAIIGLAMIFILLIRRRKA